ncbi:MAG: SsrA-binding protein SmpB [Clostridiales bacterium]|jgi:SsrA-binding protein|nr:SsrA-binding protein SmpB [Clostridiales bacterium]
MNKDRRHKLIAQNKKARYNYFLEETFQAGIELFGMEVKSLRAGRCNITDSYVEIKDGQAYVVNMHISPYEYANILQKDPMRKRRLLLHKREINKLFAAITRDGYTVVPVKIYFSGPYVKLDIALAKGKKLHDKRHEIAKKDARRASEKEFKIKNL